MRYIPRSISTISAPFVRLRHTQGGPLAGRPSRVSYALVFARVFVRAFCAMKRSTASLASTSGICFGGDFIR
jgi:hypothetical protein